VLDDLVVLLISCQIDREFNYLGGAMLHVEAGNAHARVKKLNNLVYTV